MKTPARNRRQAIVLVAALTAAFGVLAVSFSTLFDWKTAFAALMTCPVGVALLWFSRDEQTPQERIEECDAKRRAESARAEVLVHPAWQATVPVPTKLAS